MKSRFILLTLIAMGSAIQTTPTYTWKESRAKKERIKEVRLWLRKRFLAAKKLYENGKKSGLPAAELTKLQQEMKKARRQWIDAIIVPKKTLY